MQEVGWEGVGCSGQGKFGLGGGWETHVSEVKCERFKRFLCDILPNESCLPMSTEFPSESTVSRLK